MKKYLITAAMAVAVSGALVSCHEDEITGSAVEQKIQAFEDLFVQAFGKPDPNHTWGFGDPIVVEEARTRASINVNGNLWETRPEVTDAEKQKVFDYVNMTLAEMTAAEHPYYETMPEQLVNYYVTQVYTGTDKYTTWQDRTKDPWILGSEKMNNLHIAMDADATLSVQNWKLVCDGDWEHINNFNASSNTNYGGNTLVIGGGTYDFAYQGSEDSNYHNKWIAVKGSDIDPTLAPYYYICIDHVAYPVGTKSYFKLYVNEQGVQDGTRHHEIRVAVEGTYGSAQALLDGNIRTVTYDGKTYNVGTDWTYDGMDNPNQCIPANEVYTDWIIRLVIANPKVDIPKVKVPTATGGKTTRVIKSGEQVVQSGRVFCEDIVAAQYKYEDLDYNDVVFDAAIVHKYRKLILTHYDEHDNLITPTEDHPNPEIKYDFSGIDGQADGYSEYYAKVCLLAAGGTLPISIQVRRNADEILYNGEIHNILGGKSSSIMINTLSKNERERVNMATVDYSPIDNDTQTRHAVDLTRVVDKVTTDKFELDDNNPNYIDINKCVKLDVQYDNVAATIESKYYGGQRDVVASAKFMVPLGTPWAKERVNIAKAYEDFPKWVGNETNEDGTVKYPFWDKPSEDANFYFDPKYDLAVIPGLDPAVWSKGNFINGTTYTVSEETTTQLPDINGISISEVDPLNPIFTIPDNQTETILYDFTIPTVGPGYLYDGNQVAVASNTPITTGSKIRIYGVSTEGWEVTVDNQTKSASNGGNYTTKGYIEFDVTSNIGKILQITGKNFTITYVTLVSSNGGGGNGAKAGQFWPSDKANGNATSMFSIDSDTMGNALANANTSNKICVYCTVGTWIQLYRGDWADPWAITNIPSGWKKANNKELGPTNGFNSVYNQTKGCVEIPLTQEFIADVSTYGLGFNFNDLTITNITVE